MKKIFVLLLALSFISCDVIDKLTHFDIDNETSFTVPSTTIVNAPLNLNTPNVTTNSSSEFDNNNTNSDLVESIKLSSLNLTINSPTDGNFNFLKSVQIYINADGLDEAEIANIFDLEDDGLNSINLNSTNIELREYIKKDHYTLRVNTVTDQTIAQDHEITANSTFRVDAEILGI